MSILEVTEPDPRAERRARRLRQAALGLLVFAVLAAVVAFWTRHWPEESVVDQFFRKVEQKDWVAAFAVWNADPDWQSHAERYTNYTFGQFQLDWGPTGDFGEITEHEIVTTLVPPSRQTETSGKVVVVRVNQRIQPACLWVEVRTKVISYSPLPCRL